MYWVYGRAKVDFVIRESVFVQAEDDRLPPHKWKGIVFDTYSTILNSPDNVYCKTLTPCFIAFLSFVSDMIRSHRRIEEISPTCLYFPNFT
jgi:hypothetical protein